MTLSLSIILILIVLSIGVSAISKVYITPIKFVMTILVLTTFGLFGGGYSGLVELICLLIFLLVFAALLIEHKIVRVSYLPFECKMVNISGGEIRKIIYFCWLFTVFPVIAFLMLVQKSGGILEHFASLSLRVVEWRGEGLKVALVRSIPVLNLIYFCVLSVAREKVTKVQWVLFLMHFLIFMLLALGSGSRNIVLLNFVLVIMFQFLLGRSIRKMYALGLAVMIVGLLLLLGGVRNNFSYDKGYADINVESSYLDNKAFSYSLEPLETLLESGIKEIYYGKTYFSLITNFVPRSVWPGKPDTGGVIFTEEYMGDYWKGFSYTSTGLIVEALMNFGYFLGVLFALSLLVFLLVISLKWFRYIVSSWEINARLLFSIIGFMYFVFALSNVFFAEFTANYFNLILRLLPLYLIYFISRIKLSRNL